LSQNPVGNVDLTTRSPFVITIPQQSFMVPDGPQTFPFPRFHVPGHGVCKSVRSESLRFSLYSDEHKRADGCELRDPYLVRCWQRVYLGHLLTLDIGHTSTSILAVASYEQNLDDIVKSHVVAPSASSCTYAITGLFRLQPDNNYPTCGVAYPMVWWRDRLGRCIGSGSACAI